VDYRPTHQLLVSWSLTSLFRTNTPISETNRLINYLVLKLFHHNRETDRHPLDGLFSRAIWAFWILMKQQMMGWQWHQLDHMQIICISLQTDNHTSTSSLNVLQAACSSWCPTNSVKALKAMIYHKTKQQIFKRSHQILNVSLHYPVKYLTSVSNLTEVNSAVSLYDQRGLRTAVHPPCILLTSLWECVQ